jgi:hypothetical protein
VPPRLQILFQGRTDTVLAHDLAIRHHPHAACLPGDGGIMGDDHEGDSLGSVEFLQQVHQILSGVGIQASGGLVGQHQGRLVRLGAGHRHPLALPSG